MAAHEERAPDLHRVPAKDAAVGRPITRLMVVLLVLAAVAAVAVSVTVTASSRIDSSARPPTAATQSRG